MFRCNFCWLLHQETSSLWLLICGRGWILGLRDIWGKRCIEFTAGGENNCRSRFIRCHDVKMPFPPNIHMARLCLKLLKLQICLITSVTTVWHLPRNAWTFYIHHVMIYYISSLHHDVPGYDTAIYINWIKCIIK